MNEGQKYFLKCAKINCKTVIGKSKSVMMHTSEIILLGITERKMK